MTLEEIFNALDAYLHVNWTITSIQDDDDKFDTETSTEHIYPVFVPDWVIEEEIAGSNSARIDKRYGSYLINIYRPKNEGLATALEYASAIEALFYYKDIKCVFTERPHTRRMGIEGNFFRLAVTVPWWAWVNE